MPVSVKGRDMEAIINGRVPMDGFPVGGNPMAGGYLPYPGLAFPRPVNHIQGIGWVQGPNVVRPAKHNLAWVWPKDGKRGTKRGRLVDILTGKGPDMFVVANARRGDTMENRPTRSRWSQWYEFPDAEGRPDAAIRQAKWVRSKREKRPGLVYDFARRKYVLPNPHSWADARWRQSPNSPDRYPVVVRDWAGQWYGWHAME